MRWLDSNTDSTDVNLSKLQEVVEDRGAWRSTVHETAVGRDLRLNSNNKVTESCPTLCNPTDCSRLGSSIPHYLLDKPGQCIKKSRRAMVFLVMYRCEGWTIKTAEH